MGVETMLQLIIALINRQDVHEQHTKSMTCQTNKGGKYEQELT